MDIYVGRWIKRAESSRERRVNSRLIVSLDETVGSGVLRTGKDTPYILHHLSSAQRQETHIPKDSARNGFASDKDPPTRRLRLILWRCEIMVRSAEQLKTVKT